MTSGSITNAAGLSVNTNVVAGKIGGAGSITVAAGKTLQTAGVTQAALSIGTGGKATVATGRSTAKTSRIGTLTVTAGVLDLGDNDAVFTATSAATLRTALAAGANLGAYNGTTGITSASAATASTTTTRTALGYALASDLGSPTTFAGLSGINPTDVLVKYTLAGDANLDGTVDTVDFAKLIGGFASATASFVGGDFNYSGATDSADFNLLVSNYGKTAAPGVLPGVLSGEIVGGFSAPGALVPEPTSLALLGSGVTLLLKRRRR